MSKKFGLLTTAMALVAFASAALAAPPDYNAWQSAPPGYVVWPSLPTQARTAVQHAAATSIARQTAPALSFTTDPYGYDELDRAPGA